MTERPIESWRLSSAEPFGLHVWFDPRVERLVLRDLTASEMLDTLDKVVSVSALETDGETESLL